jgi:NADPH:quinone reductase-like Zn-dependent oxidoreductase
LDSLPGLGADEIVSLRQSDEAFAARIKSIHDATPIDVVVDYLWGRSAELILGALKGEGMFTHPTRFVSIGAVTGDTIRLSAEMLRSVDLRLSGSGLGSWKRDEVRKLLRKILPEMFRLAAKKKLKIDTVNMDLKEIGKLWETNLPDGKRLVVTI